MAHSYRTAHGCLPATGLEVCGCIDCPFYTPLSTLSPYTSSTFPSNNQYDIIPGSINGRGQLCSSGERVWRVCLDVEQWKTTVLFSRIPARTADTQLQKPESRARNEGNLLQLFNFPTLLSPWQRKCISLLIPNVGVFDSLLIHADEGSPVYTCISSLCWDCLIKFYKA